MRRRNRLRDRRWDGAVSYTNVNHPNSREPMDHIRVTCDNPVCKSEFTVRYTDGFDDEDARERFVIGQLPNQRWVYGLKVDEPMLHFCSPACALSMA